MRLFNRQERALLLAAVLVAVSVGTAAAQDGSFTDSRDGQKYTTVTIGNQVWLAENLRFNVGGSWCYENNNDNCKKYGRLYNWNAAKAVCPMGWHLPSRGEWTRLVAMAGSKMGGKKLKSASGWNKNGEGTDDYGFLALPGGRRYTDGSFRYVGMRGYWWSATGVGSGYAYYRDVRSGKDYVDEYIDDKTEGYSVRCVQDN